MLDRLIVSVPSGDWHCIALCWVWIVSKVKGITISVIKKWKYEWKSRHVKQYRNKIIQWKFKKSKKKNAYIASSQAKLERGGVIAWLCIQTIRINIAFFSTGQIQVLDTVRWRVLWGFKQACRLQVVISLVRDQTMSPPILKCTKVVMVVISDCIAYLNFSGITKLQKQA